MVVAIIGILAAVGTVAYTGYTKNAKKNATKSNHAAVVKYIAAEMTKCSMGETTVLKTLTCATSYTDGVIATAAVGALSDFKNPYATDKQAVRPNAGDSATAVTSNLFADRGYVNLTASGNTITVTTCFDDTTDTGNSACTAGAVDSIVNTILIGE